MSYIVVLQEQEVNSIVSALIETRNPNHTKLIDKIKAQCNFENRDFRYEIIGNHPILQYVNVKRNTKNQVISIVRELKRMGYETKVIDKQEKKQ